MLWCASLYNMVLVFPIELKEENEEGEMCIAYFEDSASCWKCVADTVIQKVGYLWGRKKVKDLRIWAQIMCSYHLSGLTFDQLHLWDHDGPKKEKEGTNMMSWTPQA